MPADIRTHVTLVPFVTATGKVIYTAVLIQKGSEVEYATDIMESLKDIDDIGVWRTPSGWMTSECFEQIWIEIRERLHHHRKQPPIPPGLKGKAYMDAVANTEWLMFFMDNHSTHIYNPKVCSILLICLSSISSAQS
jgi:hypothetical protein